MAKPAVMHQSRRDKACSHFGFSIEHDLFGKSYTLGAGAALRVRITLQ
jgi:hypothetical protein